MNKVIKNKQVKLSEVEWKSTYKFIVTSVCNLSSITLPDKESFEDWRDNKVKKLSDYPVYIDECNSGMFLSIRM